MVRILILATLIAFTGLFGCTSKPSQKPNVILIVLDTLRADHLSFYGYERATSPNLDAFARENMAFMYALTAAPWTPPSVASIFTGMYPVTHAMMPPNERDEARKALSKLDQQLVTLSDIFKQNGYSTAGVTPNPWTNPEFGYHQGFDDYRYVHRVNADLINKEGMQIIEKFSAAKQPFFLYLHYLDPHDPYNPPGAFKNMYSGAADSRAKAYSEKMARNIGLYDGEIQFMDQELGKLFQFLKDKGQYKDTIIAIVGDHGEQFMEHGDHRHGFKLYNDELHVPLFIKAGSRGLVKKVETTVSTIDIYPTLMELAGIKIPEFVQGISLLDEENLNKRDGVMSEINRRYNMKAFTDYAGRKIMLNATTKNDEPLQSSLIGVFDRKKDYLELAPLNTDKELEQSLYSTLKITHANALKLRIHSSQAEAEVSKDTLEQLKSLGYLQ